MGIEYKIEKIESVTISNAHCDKCKKPVGFLYQYKDIENSSHVTNSESHLSGITITHSFGYGTEYDGLTAELTLCDYCFIDAIKYNGGLIK